MGVHAVAEAARHEVFGNIAMGDLPQRMHAGIGAASPMNAHWHTEDRLRRRLAELQG